MKARVESTKSGRLAGFWLMRENKPCQTYKFIHEVIFSASPIVLRVMRLVTFPRSLFRYQYHLPRFAKGCFCKAIGVGSEHSV